MIKVSISEAEAFDRLSILQVKAKNHLEVHEEVKMLWADMLEQIGHEKIIEVMTSHNWRELYDANIRVFKLVALAKNDEVKASEVESTNYERFEAKKSIQERFFNGDILEKKVRG